MNKAQDFFTAPKSLGLAGSVASLVASAAGVWIIFTPVETAAWAGISGISGYALGQALPLFALAIIGIPMLKSLPKGYSLPYWAGQRYGGVMRIITLAICLFYLTVFLAAELTAIGKAGQLLTSAPTWLVVTFITALTWSYTYKGGFRLVVKTDIAQFAIFLPLLAIIFFFILTQSPKPLLSSLATAEPHLLDFGFRPGLEFGITLIIAILAAQVFNQSLWQRVHAAKDERTMRLAFVIAGLLMIPLILATGYLGLVAKDILTEPSSPETGIFELLRLFASPWLLAIFGLVALLLVMSSADSILNALSSLVTEELNLRNEKKLDLESSSARQKGRWITSAFALGVAIIAMQGYSVLYLFLLADLVCAASMVPIFAGLYTSRCEQRATYISIALGLVCGITFMLRPDLSTPLISNPIGSSWLLSFAGAMLVSSLSTAVFIIFAPSSARTLIEPEPTGD